MTRHGGTKRLKRLNTPAHLQIKRKHGKFFINPSPGPHSKKFCLPLLYIIRDLLKIVSTHREAKKLIGLGYFMIDGKVVRNKSFPVGLMDVLSIPKIKKYYRILPDSHYGLILHEISEGESIYKLCRLANKTTVKGGHIQLNLHDGRNILIRVSDPKKPKEDKYSMHSVLKISLPDQEILKYIKLESGVMGLICAGKNIGGLGKVIEISKRFGPNASTVTIETKNGEKIQTSYDYIFPIGETDSEINIPTPV